MVFFRNYYLWKFAFTLIFFNFVILMCLLISHGNILDQWYISKDGCQKDRHCCQEISPWKFFSANKVSICQPWVNQNRRERWWSRYLFSFLLFGFFQKDRHCCQEISPWKFFSANKVSICQPWVNQNRRERWWSRYLFSFLLFGFFV